ncbi:MAG TPA: trimeric intracellular cation channel family protein [Hanamia sp.]|nr:trimeric intracellular cation channel family protein [Hanamia sp.]
MKHEFLQLIDILGTVAFAVSGVFAAMQKKLDVFGILIIAFVTAIGGGTLRDMMIGDLPVSWMKDINYSIIILVTTAVVIFFNKTINNFQKTLLVFDSIGLGFFTILGIQKGITFGLHPAICIALGTVTACFGGVIRDISLNNIPLIFQKEIYATACIFGGCNYFLLLQTSLSIGLIEALCIVLIVLVRILAVRYNWSLPGIYQQQKK